MQKQCHFGGGGGGGGSSFFGKPCFNNANAIAVLLLGDLRVSQNSPKRGVNFRQISAILTVTKKIKTPYNPFVLVVRDRKEIEDICLYTMFFV